MNDKERLTKQVKESDPCRDNSDRGYWRKRLRDLEQGKVNEADSKSN